MREEHGVGGWKEREREREEEGEREREGRLCDKLYRRVNAHNKKKKMRDQILCIRMVCVCVCVCVCLFPSHVLFECVVHVCVGGARNGRVGVGGWGSKEEEGKQYPTQGRAVVGGA